MAKRLSEDQKKEILLGFTKGKTVDFLSKNFKCTKSTIIRNLKKNLSQLEYQKLINKSKSSKQIFIRTQSKTTRNNPPESNSKKTTNLLSNINPSYENSNEGDFSPQSSFLEIVPLDYEIENVPRKELSSIPIAEIDFPDVVFMIVDKKIELEIKLLRDYPDWQFLPQDDLKRKTIEIFFDLKTAKRYCTKEQKVIKVPNPDVFRIASPILLSRGISRIISSDKLIAL